MGTDAKGNLVYNKYFKPTYYHLQTEHIAQKNPQFKKNPEVFVSKENCQILMTDVACKSVLATIDFILRVDN